LKQQSNREENATPMRQRGAAISRCHRTAWVALFASSLSSVLETSRKFALSRAGRRAAPRSLGEMGDAPCIESALPKYLKYLEYLKAI
jgi:truncated hemoglobin YjbI